ncbi:NADP-dependent oxidoreductase domain-containing protein [Mycena maculata]|uniref:NADP-dependent oxidoreductase domain-containing protein n=1 Tax=Mycena maculata TaxID=230809 RepID=A0AAD7ICV9_9AGAR|nr:NADP-dependent oxidoreductase domain-containing protein [Mycena maculata]
MAKPISNIGRVLWLFASLVPREIIRVTTHEATIELLDIFQKHGHNEIDTARVYGGGMSEDTVGWQERGIKMETKIYPTKARDMEWLFAEDLTHSPADLRKALKKSLTALKTDKLYMFHLHGPDRSFQSWGVAQICEICKRNGWVIPTVYQHRGVEAELIPCLRAYGISFYVFNPLAGGFLTSRYTRDQATFEAGERFDPEGKQGQLLRMRYWNEPSFKALDLLRPAIAPHGITESEAALRWLAHHSVLKREFGDAVIVGASSKKHLEDNLEALDKGPLPADVVEALEAGWEHARALPLKYWH